MAGKKQAGTVIVSDTYTSRKDDASASICQECYECWVVVPDKGAQSIKLFY